MHEHIVKTKEQVVIDNQNHTSHQYDLKQQIAQLHQQLEAEKQRQYDKDLQHRAEVEEHRGVITDLRNRLAQRDDEYEQLRASTQ